MCKLSNEWERPVSWVHWGQFPTLFFFLEVCLNGCTACFPPKCLTVTEIFLVRIVSVESKFCGIGPGRAWIRSILGYSTSAKEPSFSAASVGRRLVCEVVDRHGCSCRLSVLVLSSCNYLSILFKVQSHQDSIPLDGRVFILTYIHPKFGSMLEF